MQKKEYNKRNMFVAISRYFNEKSPNKDGIKTYTLTGIVGYLREILGINPPTVTIKKIKNIKPAQETLKKIIKGMDLENIKLYKKSYVRKSNDQT